MSRTQSGSEAPLRYVVTGAASGIGKAIVEGLAARGGQGIAADLRLPELDLPGVTCLQADVTSEDDWGRIAATLDEADGRLDVLIHAAGIQQSSPLSDLGRSSLDRVLNVNLVAPILGTQRLLAHLANASGSVVMLGSSLGLVGAANQAAYSASKGGVISLTRALAAELGPLGVRVNCLCPGPVGTELFWSNARAHAPESMSDDDIAAPFAEKTMLGRIADPGEIAHAAIFLASPEAAFITGTVMPVDGGKTAL